MPDPVPSADPVPQAVRQAFEVLYQAARLAPLNANAHEGVLRATQTLNEALVAAYAPPAAPADLPVETRA